MQSIKRTDSNTPLGELANYSIRSSATPFDPTDSSGEIPSFSVMLSDLKGDAKSLIGSSVSLRDWTGFKYFSDESGQVTEGRVVSVRKGGRSNTASLDVNSIFERLNTEQTTLPILQGDTLDNPVSEALRHWCLTAGITPDRIEGNLHTYISKYSTIGYLGQSKYKWRYSGPPTTYRDYITTESSLGGDAPPLEVNLSQSLTFGMKIESGFNSSDFQFTGYAGKYFDTVIWTLRRLGSSWYFYEKIGSATSTLLKSWVQAPSDTNPMYFFAKIDANAAADKVDIQFRLLDWDWTTQQTVLYDSPVSTGVTSVLRDRPIPRSMRLGYASSISSGRVPGAPDSVFITEDATLQSVYPASQLYISPFLNTPPTAADLAKMPDFIPGFTGNVWDKMREFCAILDLDIFYQNGVLSIRARETRRRREDGKFIPAQRLVKGNLTEQAQDRDTARKIEINYYERQPGSDNFDVMFKADSVYTLEKGETLVEKVQTDNTFIFLNQPIPVSGVPVPYTSAFGSYVITGADGYIVDPVWWRDNGGSITVKTTENSGEIEITMQAPTVDTVRAPYRVSEGVSDRPALYIVGYGLALKKPKTIQIYTGASRAAQEVGTTFDSTFVTKRLIAMNAGHRIAETYGTGEVTVNFDVSRADVTEPNDSAQPPAPVGDSIYWSGSYFRLMGQVIDPNGLQYSDCHTHNTISVINGEFAEAKTIADWNALHDGHTIANVNMAPLPYWES